MVAAEPGHDEERRPPRLSVSLRQDHRRAVADRPAVERREDRARDVHELDPVGLLERLRGDQAIDGQANRAAGLGVEHGADDRPEGVALAVSQGMGVGIEPDDGLGRVFPWLEAVERGGEPDGMTPTWSGSPGFQSRASTAKRLRLEPIEAVAGLAPPPRRLELPT